MTEKYSLEWLESDPKRELIEILARDIHYLRESGHQVDVISFLAHCRKSSYNIPEDLSGMLDLFRKSALASVQYRQ